MLGTEAVPAVSPTCFFFSVSPDGLVRHASGPGLDVVGLPSSSLVGRPLDEVCATNPEALAACRRALAGWEVEAVVEWSGVLWSTWCIPVRKDGRIVRVDGFAVRYEDTGAPLYYIHEAVLPPLLRSGAAKPYHPPVKTSRRLLRRPSYLRVL